MLIVPTGTTLDDVKARKRIIIRFYQEWKANNPSQKRYNLNLKDYINIRNISMAETSAHAAKNYLSTLAVLQLDAILTNAKRVGIEKAKINKNQKSFNKMILMEYALPAIGAVRLTVGIKRGTNEKVQYCITAIQTK